MRAKLLLAAALVFLLAACQTSAPDPSGSARDRDAALMAALDYIQMESIWREGKDWAAVRAEAQSRWGEAIDDRQRAAVFTSVFQALGDAHSSARVGESVSSPWRGPTPEQLRVFQVVGVFAQANANAPSGRLLDSNTAYLLLPSMGAPDADAARALAIRLDALACDLARQGATRWVMDLRANLGGNVHSMLNDLAQLVGDGPVGAQIDAHGNVRTWRILLKNSDLGEARNFAFPLNRIAHHRHEGIAADAENLAQEPRSAFAPASSEIAPLQIQMNENQAPSRKRVFQQYWRIEDGQFIMGEAPAFPFASACDIEAANHTIVALMSAVTLSSGQFVALAIRGRTRSEVLGAAGAAGYATINSDRQISPTIAVNLPSPIRSTGQASFLSRAFDRRSLSRARCSSKTLKGTNGSRRAILDQVQTR